MKLYLNELKGYYFIHVHVCYWCSSGWVPEKDSCSKEIHFKGETRDLKEILSGTNVDGISKGQRGLEDRLRIRPNRKVSRPLFLSGQP